MTKSLRAAGSLISALTLLFATSVAEAQAPTRMAVVDTQRAIMETEDGLRAQATLKKLFDNRQRELDKKQDDLQKERVDIDKQKDVLSKAALTKRIDKWQQEMVQLQQVFVEYNKELQKKQNELTQPIFQKAMGLIRRLATQEGFDLIVDKQAVPYVRSDLDVTDRLITLYNQGVAPEAAPAAGKTAPTPPTLKAPEATPPKP
ncbi:MAG TPA: OmpH family outer membrane protein [Polyangiaceae bacterium]|jgi:outer membrane protein|nr:OmpH family outer membrane protein [Polyangiaceae bacterium]